MRRRILTEKEVAAAHALGVLGGALDDEEVQAFFLEWLSAPEDGAAARESARRIAAILHQANIIRGVYG